MVEWQLLYKVDSVACKKASLLLHNDKIFCNMIFQNNLLDFAFAKGFIFFIFNIIIVSLNQLSSINLFGQLDILIR